IRHLVLTVNKMDLVDYDRETFENIVEEYRSFASEIGIEAFTAIPISGFKGDNITQAPSANTLWYEGPSLIHHLENVEIANTAAQTRSFRMPVQWVNRPNLDFRGFSGLIASGEIAPGNQVRIVPSGKTSTIKSIVTMPSLGVGAGGADGAGDLERAVAGQSV